MTSSGEDEATVRRAMRLMSPEALAGFALMAKARRMDVESLVGACLRTFAEWGDSDPGVRPEPWIAEILAESRRRAIEHERDLITRLDLPDTT